jgi:uncharacterized protein
MSDSQGTPDFEKKPQQPEGQPPYGQQPPAAQPPQYGAPPPPPQYGHPQQPQYGAPQQPQYGAQQQPQYGAPQQFGAPPYGAPRTLPPDQERLWGGAAHWSALVASLLGLAFVGPLIVMLTKGNESAFVRRQAVESLNFQLSMLIYAIASAILIIVLVGFLLLLVVAVLWLVFTIMGAIKASNGEDYRYPLTLRMVS